MIQLQFQYRVIASFTVEHQYYAKSLAKDLHFLPAPESAALAERIGLFLKITDAGISLSYDVFMGDALLRYILDNEDLYFDFYLVTSNFHFVNFTDMPTESVGNLYYYDTDNATKEEKGQHRLHKNDYVDSADSLPMVDADFYRETKNKVDYALKNDAGQILREGSVSGKYKVALAGLPAGRYGVYENGKFQQGFVYRAVDFKRRHRLAMIRLSIKGGLRKSIITTLEQGQVISESKYKLKFDSRNTYWKYFIVSKYKLPLEKSGIDTNDTDIEFVGPEKVSLSNGETAFLFESKVSLPLKEIQDLNFKLSKDRKSGRGNGEAYLNRLPTPSADMIRPASRDEAAKVYSELIVYV